MFCHATLSSKMKNYMTICPLHIFTRYKGLGPLIYVFDKLLSFIFKARGMICFSDCFEVLMLVRLLK